MSFKLAQKKIFKQKVIVSTPNEESGFDTSDFVATFKSPTLPELEALRKLPQTEVLRAVVKGWSGLKDDEDGDVPFNESNLEALLLIPQAVEAAAAAFWNGIFKAKEKN